MDGKRRIQAGSTARAVVRMVRCRAAALGLPIVTAMLLTAGYAAAVFAQAAPTAPPPPPPTISVSGQATASQAPDVATIYGSVVTQSDTPATAVNANSTTTNAVIAAVKALGVTDADIQTSGFSVGPQYSYTQPEPGQPTPPPQVVGFQATNSISVQTHNFDQIGDLFAAIASAGATDLGGPTYSISDTESLRVRAVAAAAADALSQARAIAAALGVTLGNVISVNEGYTNAPPPPAPPLAIPRPSPIPSPTVAAPPISPPSTLSVTASVNVVIAIVNPTPAAEPPDPQ